MNKGNFVFAKGKKVYFINGVSFENSKDRMDGLEKAKNFALDNGLNPNDIIKFDSRVERDRYIYLLAKQEKDEIKNLTHHFVFKIQNSFINANGDEIPAITYESDFSYIEGDKKIVEDTKGSPYFIDEYFITLKKVFDNIFLSKNIYLRVMIPDKGEWVEWKIGEQKKSQKLVSKQREKIKALKYTSHLRDLEDKKIFRYKTRYGELIAKERLNKRERERLNEISNYLKEKGMIL